MATADILSQDEIDALLGGVSEGGVTTEPSEPLAEGEVRLYDFTSQDRIVRGRMPTLEMINERFARNWRVSLYNLLRRSPEISVGNVQLVKFSEYVQSLFMPANMNLVKCRPLRGTALFTFDPKLIFGVVDTYFGGSGRFQSKVDERDFTPTELHIVERLLEHLFADLAEAWGLVSDLSFEFAGSEVNPLLANIVSPSEVVVVTVFNVDLEGHGGGEFHLAMPYSMIEPIRELLDTGMQSDRSDRDDRWLHSLRDQIEGVELELRASLTEARMSLRELVALEQGDVVAVELPDSVVATAEGVPVLRARFGVSRGSLALKVVNGVDPSRPQAPILPQEAVNE